MSKEIHHDDGLIEYQEVWAYIRRDGSVSIFIPWGNNHNILYDTLDHKSAAERTAAELRAQRDEYKKQFEIALSSWKDEHIANATLEQRVRELTAQIEAMRNNIAGMEQNREASQAHWLDEALNSGDGVYRP